MYFYTVIHLNNAILREKEKFEALFQHASLGILVANEKGLIEMVNACLLEQFNYPSADELIGEPIEKLIPNRYHTKHSTYRENYSKHPEPRAMGTGRDLFAAKKNGTEFPVEISLSNYITNDGKYNIAFIIDITKRKEIENDVKIQKEQLATVNLRIEHLNNELERKVSERTLQLQETMEQLSSSRDELTQALSKEKDLSDLKSRFVSMASHEFRTPLSTILSSASLLAKYTESDEQDKRNKHIDRIKSSVNNLTGILNEFLSIGKIEDGKIETNNINFNLKDLISATIAEMKAMCNFTRTFTYEHKGNAWCCTDPSLVKNIILNLLSNAIKFTVENGEIKVLSSSGTDEISISISDNGIGISEQDQLHLFERFFRAKNAVNIQGTGLGLHIVAKYVELLEGKILWESKLEEGTTFNIQLPAQKNLPL